MDSFEPQDRSIHSSENPEPSTSELFSGKLTLAEALQKVRAKLLDLSSRNRLLNYRHPRGKSIQFIDAPNLDLVYVKLIDGKGIRLLPVPEPLPEEYENKRPDPKIHAATLGIKVDVEFPPECCADTTHQHTPKLQTPFYPDGLDKLCRKLSSEARTVIEETGTNMLYLIPGFLEFYESESSEKPMLAPLLAVPVSFEKQGVDPQTRTWKYDLRFTGEDFHENKTLKEKLGQDHCFQLPEFQEDDLPSTYFARIQESLRTKKRWRVRYQLTLGFLSFSKLAIWDDLDPDKYPGLLSNELLRAIFSGSDSGKGGHTSEDYEIDRHPQGNMLLIYDADSSQHSAIIDVMDGKDMVINGPPGTGKSQTITNIIAAALHAGKKVLFVSEKMAALEVVRQRLDLANLGHFCLELHSHKTNKKKLLEDLQERIDMRFAPPAQFHDRLATLARYKQVLNGHAEIMASHSGSQLGLTTHDIFWRTERLRHNIEAYVPIVNSLFIDEAVGCNYDRIRSLHDRLGALGKCHQAIVHYDARYPWWGFTPQGLKPGDAQAIENLILEAESLATELHGALNELQERTRYPHEPGLADIPILLTSIETLAGPPAQLDGRLLERLTSSDGVVLKERLEVLEELVEQVSMANGLLMEAGGTLPTGYSPGEALLEDLPDAIAATLLPQARSLTLGQFDAKVVVTRQTAERFTPLAGRDGFKFVRFPPDFSEALETRMDAVSPIMAHSLPRSRLMAGAALLSTEAGRRRAALSRIRVVADRRGFALDDTPPGLAALGERNLIPGLLPEAVVDDAVLQRSEQFAKWLFPDIPLEEIHRRSTELRALHGRLSKLIGRAEEIAGELDLSFDTRKSLAHMAVIASIAESAPLELMDYRRPSFARHGAIDLLNDAERLHSNERSKRQSLEQDFYLEDLPEADLLKQHLRLFREGDSWTHMFSSRWRRAKKQFRSLCKDKKRKRKADEYASGLDGLLGWISIRIAFENHGAFSEAFGPLFKGVDTDFTKIKLLQAWYFQSSSTLLQHSELAQSIDLSTIDSLRLSRLTQLAPEIQDLKTGFEECTRTVGLLLGSIAEKFEAQFAKSSLQEYAAKVQELAVGLGVVASFLDGLVTAKVTPRQAFELLTAKRELSGLQEDFALLGAGFPELKSEAEAVLPGFSRISCQGWNDYLDTLESLVQSIHGLCDFSEPYVDDGIAMGDLRDFVAHKEALTQELDRLTPRPTTLATDWPGYLAESTSRLESLESLARSLTGAGSQDSTLADIAAALGKMRDAHRIARAIQQDLTASRLISDLFSGALPPTQPLADTLAWAKAVRNNPAINGTPLGRSLLSPRAAEEYPWILSMLRKADGCLDSTRRTLSGLGAFGQFDWHHWNGLERSPEPAHLASELLERVSRAARAADALTPWHHYHLERAKCLDLGLAPFVDLLERESLTSSTVADAFEFVCYRSIGRAIYREFPELEGFSGIQHDQGRAQYVALDKEIIGLTGKCFAHEIDRAKTVPYGMNGTSVSQKSEKCLLDHELNKQRKHLPIRQLIKRAGRAIQAYKPCFMMGPMSVAQYLEQGAVGFDLVVMDEASQLRPEEALGAIARGTQIVVVGDPKQLPPTNFFDRLTDSGDDDEEEVPAVLSGSESILDICQQLFTPVRTLRWHYRSQHESLISFSNHHFYQGKLVIFPSPHGTNPRLGVRYRY
ncbi:AAA domain-containing protein [Methylomagnum ishizawai]|uniref:AAA domain-containing protein n=1 Tax=Methylomagnum ishizawai TaxID=1760988 RepID=A0A1Y6CUH5_9GAMM|nr:DUF4011 domain-containing protein [Methylomagnum ishizawai]SMF94309.1 AAA domain-containing protein [Methylomagnum ishizawai]